MLKFLGYKINEVDFKINCDATNEKNFQITPKIRMDMRRQEQSLVLKVTVTIDKSQPTVTPFELNLVMVGSFIVDSSMSVEETRIVASQLIFPYVRAAVSGVTSLANMPPYFLPYIDFSKPVQGAESVRGKPDSTIIRTLDELD